MAIDLNELATAIGQLILRFRVRRRLAADWTTVNEVLLSAEIGLESDTGKMKFGDGTTAWVSLPYFGGGLQSVVAGTNVTVDDTDPLNPIISASGGGGGGSGPDEPPVSPTAWDDEFDYGTGIDTTGARRSGANAWTVHKTSGATGTEVVEQSVMYAAYPSSSGNSLVLQAVPSGDFEFLVKARYSGSGTWGSPALCLYNSSTGKILFLQLYESPSLVVQRGTVDPSTFVYTFSANEVTSGLANISNWNYLKIALTNSGTPTIHTLFSGTGYSFDYVELYSETVSAWLGTVTHVGFMNNAPTFGMIEFFRRTA